MEGHLLKKKIVRSKKWRVVEGDFPRLVYCLLVAAVDSWGMLPADGPTLKSQLGTFDHHTGEDYERAVKELVRCDLVTTWEHQGDPWLYVVGHDEEQARGIKKRKTKPDVPRPDLPAPKPQQGAGKPAEVEVVGEVVGEVSTFTPSPSTMPRSEQPTTHCVTLSHEVEEVLSELRQQHAKLGKYEAIGFPKHDIHFERIAKVLAERGREYCEVVQIGHLRKVKSGDSKVEGWVGAYPWAKGDQSDPDWDWIEQHHKTGSEPEKKEIVYQPGYGPS